MRALLYALGLLAGTTAVAASLMAASAQVPVATCDGFDFPVGPPDGDGYYDAQPFGTADHLGNDWNGNGGGDTDHGDPVHAVARGAVVFAADVGDGQYLAHLHFELRSTPGLPIGGGYGVDTSGHLDPTAFIAAHRP